MITDHMVRLVLVPALCPGCVCDRVTLIHTSPPHQDASLILLRKELCLTMDDIMYFKLKSRGHRSLPESPEVLCVANCGAPPCLLFPGPLISDSAILPSTFYLARTAKFAKSVCAR